MAASRMTDKRTENKEDAGRANSYQYKKWQNDWQKNRRRMYEWQNECLGIMSGKGRNRMTMLGNDVYQYV
jgi:hypothetical protein